MKGIKWKVLLLSCLICFLPILYGVYVWDKLPDMLAIHFDIYNQPDNFAPKAVVVFGLPVFMAFFQAICCFTMDINAQKYGAYKKLERVTKWIVPAMAILLEITTLEYGLGREIDVRKVAMFIAGWMLLLVGNYMPKLDYVKNYKIEKEKARKINRFIGFETVCMGVLFLISIFLPPMFSVVCIFLLIPYAVVSTLYSILVGRKKEH